MTYIRKMVEVYEVPSHDQLVCGVSAKSASIQLSGAGVYERGQLMMNDSTGRFIPATLEGMRTAREICLLCESIDTGEETVADTYGYFEGEFTGTSIKSGDIELTDDVIGLLREHRIYVR